MEPNPYFVDVRRRDAPFAPGDVVRYRGPGTCVGAYPDNCDEGIVEWIHPNRRASDGAICGWRVCVSWCDPARRSPLTGVCRARYLAKNLELVRPAKPITGWVWPELHAMRAADV